MTAITESPTVRVHAADEQAIGVVEKHMTSLIFIGVVLVAMLLVGAASVAVPMLDAVAEIDL